jgi:hypothetical protein
MLAVCLETDTKYKAEQEVPGHSRRSAPQALKDKEKGRAFQGPALFTLKTPVSVSILRSAASKKQQKKAQRSNPWQEAESQAQRRTRTGAQLRPLAVP